MTKGKKRNTGSCNDDHNTPKREAKKANANNGVSENPNISSISYWDSKYAANIFRFNYDEAENIIDGLKYIIEFLTGNFTDWKRGTNKVVTNSGEQMTKFSIFTLRNKCIYLRKSYTISLEKLG